MIVNIAICDDEVYTLARYKDEIVRFLGEPSVSVYAFTHEQDIMYAYTKSHPFDIVILDIGLGEDAKGGFRLAEKIREKDSDVYILYLTNHDEPSYFLDAISVVGAVGYVIKSRDLSQFYGKLQEIVKKVEQYRNDTITIVSKRESTILLQRDILYIHSSRNRKEIFTRNRELPYTFYVSFSEIFLQLDSEMFVEIAKGLIVNMTRIRSFSLSDGTVELENGDLLHASRSKKREAYQTYARYLKGALPS